MKKFVVGAAFALACATGATAPLPTLVGGFRTPPGNRFQIVASPITLDHVERQLKA